MNIEDIIHCEKYYELCDYHYNEDKYKSNNDLPSGVVRVDTSKIPEFFNEIKGNGKKYIIISPRSDFGVCEQRLNHPAKDLSKWMKMEERNLGYNGITMPPRINPKRCQELDKYSIKCWSYTEATFDEIPDNVVHWFLVNCNIAHERVTAIPLGINGTNGSLHDTEKILNYPKKEKTKGVYVNFQFYTTDRLELYQYCKYLQDNGFDITCKHQIDFDEYLDDLSTHKFVLCPPGNGYDCYRTLESIYMYSIPIITNDLGSALPYRDFEYPILIYPNLYAVSYDNLENLYQSVLDRLWKNNPNMVKVNSVEEAIEKNPDILDKTKWNYWKNMILTKKELLNE